MNRAECFHPPLLRVLTDPAFRVVLALPVRNIHLSWHSLGAEEGIVALRQGQMHPGHDGPVIWTTLHVRGAGEDVLPGARGRRPWFALPFVAQCDARGSGTEQPILAPMK
jgi:hypothetical protein